MRHLLKVLPALVLLLPSSAGLCGVIDVPACGLTIQGAIDAASPGDTVLVACGTYYEHDIELRSGIALASETGQADCVTIDAQQQGRVMRCDGVEDVVVVGLTLTGGLTSDSGQWFDISGGGLACVGSDPTLVNVVFEDNTGHRRGGGVWCYDSSAVFENVSFIGNHVGNIGGVGDGGGLSANLGSAVELTDVVFVGNTAAGDGGGAYFTGAPVLTRCWFEGNSAEWGGGLACVGGWSSPSISEVTLVANSAYAGGGISSRDGAGPVLENVTVVGNVADYGAGIDIAQSSYVTIDNTIVAMNYPDVAIACFLTPAPTLTCCDLFGNAGGDWVGCISDQYGPNGNIWLDPLFCGDANPDAPYVLDADSPCTPANSGCGELIGAWPVGCGTTPVESTSWGTIKGMFR